MKKKGERTWVEVLEVRTLFSLPFGSATTSDITLNPQHSVALVNVVSGPLLSADFNNDGKADLVFGGRSAGDDSSTHYVGVMLGSATGAFTDAGTLTAPGDVGLSTYAAGDFNGDGNQDIAIVYPTLSDGAFVYNLLVGLGNGNGTFTPQPVFGFDATSFVPSQDALAPASIAVAKFDGGTNDQMAVVLPTSSTEEDLDVLGLDNTSHFARLGDVTLFGLAGGDDQIVAGHFDSGTLPDVAVFDPNASKAMIAFTGGGDSFLGFDPISIAPPPANASASVMAAGDFNSDGKTDMVIQQTAPGINQTNLDVLLNNGFGGATALPPVADGSPGPAGGSLDWLKVGVFESNEEDEIATRYGIFRADGAGTLLPSGIPTFADTQSNNAVIGDFNGDGAPDLVSVVGTGVDAVTIELKLGATSTPLKDFIFNLSDQSTKNGVGAIAAAKFTINVGGTNSTPTGTVDFYAVELSNNSVVNLGTATLANGTATITPTNVPVGKDNIFAAYSGDASFLGGTSDNITVTYAGGGTGGVVSALESGIIKSTLPQAAVSGAKLGKSVTVSVKNTGSKLFNDRTTINLFASLDRIIDPGDTLVASLTKTLKIAPGKTTNLVIPVKSLPASLSGNYGVLEETVESGIQTSVSLFGPGISAAPAFISLAPAITQSKVAPNGSLTMEITVTNNGNIPSTGSTQFLLYGSNDTTVTNGTLLLKKVLGIHLRPGKKTVVKLTANPLETQLGLASAHFVVELIDALGGTTTAATPLRD